MQLPTWDELAAVEKQLDVLEHPLDESLFVAGPPGSGKTVLAVHRAQMLADGLANSNIAVITYNRMLRRLLSQIADVRIEIGTMQSFIWCDYASRTGHEPPRFLNDPYAYDWNAMLEALDGHRSSHPNRSHVIIDEGQDLPEGFFRYATKHTSDRFTVFADDDQALTEQRTTLEQIQAATGLADPIILTNNHRNTPEVARLAEHFHSGRLPAATIARSASGERPRLVQSRSVPITVQRIANWFNTRGGSVGVIVSDNQYGSLCCTALRRDLQGKRVDRYENTLQNEDSVDVRTPGVTILNKESVKGQEFDTVFVLQIEDFVPCADDVMRRAMYMMCTRARDHLFLVYGPRPLTPQATAALPSPDILERT